MIAYHRTVAPDFLSPSDLDQLLSMGWYRMHQNIFTTSHLRIEVELYRVYWLRYPLAEISERPSHRRIRKRNQSFHHTIEDLIEIQPFQEELYSRYRASIDFQGALSIEQCLFGDNGLGRNIFQTKCISVYDHYKLIGCGYFDLGNIAGTSILHFFDPDYKSRSLGKYLMLLTMDFLNSSGCTFYYPGYLVSGIPKMDYKLFIGKEATQYFEPESKTWKRFEEDICAPENLSELERLELMLAFMA